jgi:hypothetical protein
MANIGNLVQLVKLDGKAQCNEWGIQQSFKDLDGNGN